MQTEHTSGH